MSWKCTNCGFTLEAKAPPEQCPNCNHKCEFINTTCYIPDCGGPDEGGSDERLK